MAHSTLFKDLLKSRATTTPINHVEENALSTFEPYKESFELMTQACYRESRTCLEILDSSFGSQLDAPIDGSPNGVVYGAIASRSKGYSVLCRQEDGWFAILSQLSFYINAHAEELRSRFVKHKGKKVLELKYDGSRYDVKFGHFAKQMSKLIKRHLIDPDLCRSLVPPFKTISETDDISETDVIVASILLMGATQKYFDFKCTMRYDLQTVIQVNDRADSDSEPVTPRLERLEDLGNEPKQFCALLKPVISRCTGSFMARKAKEVDDFWHRMAHFTGGGNKPSYYSGWITAFCFWDEHGKSLYRPSRVKDKDAWENSRKLKMDGAVYHRIKSDQVPPGYTTVSVKMDDNKVVFDATMIAGSVGVRHVEENGVQPESGWWIFVRKYEDDDDDDDEESDEDEEDEEVAR